MMRLNKTILLILMIGFLNGCMKDPRTVWLDRLMAQGDVKDISVNGEQLTIRMIGDCE